MKKRDDGFQIISNYKLLCCVGAKFVFYHSGKVYIGDSLNPPYKLLLKLPGWKTRVLISIRLIERMLRLEPRLAFPINDTEFLLSYQGSILRINLEGQFFEEHRYVKPMNNPLSFCTENGRFLYGEYFGNLNHQEVRVFERDRKGSWNVVLTFAKGEIQHIHQIKYDWFRNCYWILTGDADNESAIWKASPNFDSAVAIFRGKQKYRSCFIMPTEKGLYYATDTPLEENWIYFAEQQGSIFLEPRRCYKMAGPCIYGKCLGNQGYVMATSVEPDPTLPTVIYYFTNKLGAGIRDRKTTIVYGNPCIGFSEVANIEKDFLGMWLFQFGNMLFPTVSSDKGILCTGQSLKRIDGKTIMLDYQSTIASLN